MSFYRTYWEIIKKEVSDAVVQFFSTGWLPQGFNSNVLVLIPKTDNTNSLDMFPPIALSHFKFKIISKIIATRLATIMPQLVSREQRGFIKGRKIKDCIALACEEFNLLDYKSWCGNVALKVDIMKAFDTLNWLFLLKILKQFSLNNKFYQWIHNILHSFWISISVNGSLKGFFNFTPGVRQGDHLSPLLFCLAEDVLIRHISRLMDPGSLSLISGTNSILVQSHISYADDVLILWKGSLANMCRLI